MLEPNRFNAFGIVLLIVLLVAVSCAPIPSNQQIGIVRADGPAAYLNRQLVRDGAPLFNGNHVSTGPNSSAKVIFNRGGFVQLNENTDPTFQQFFEAAKCIIRVVLKVGEIFAENSQSCSIETETPNASVTQHSQLNIRVGGGETTVTVLRGGATFTQLGNARLRSGEQVTIRNGRITSRRTLNRQEQQRLIRWRDRYKFPQLIRIPDLKQLDLRQGERRLGQTELRLGNVTRRPENRFRPGTIVDQRPGVGSSVRPGTRVDVTVASEQWSTVPNLTGLTLGRARDLLRRAKLAPGRITERDRKGVAPDTVVGQSVRGGSRLLAGRTVDLTVARVPDVIVPNLQRMSERAALDTLRRYSLKPGSISRKRTDKFLAGTVINQSPPPRRSVRPGTRVDFTIAEPTSIPVPNFSGLNMGSAHALARRNNLRVREAGRRVVGGRIPIGNVIGQRPPPQSRVPPGTVIDLWLQGTLK